MKTSANRIQHLYPTLQQLNVHGIPQNYSALSNFMITPQAWHQLKRCPRDTAKTRQQFILRILSSNNSYGERGLLMLLKQRQI
jgi:hypothetical protein